MNKTEVLFRDQNRVLAKSARSGKPVFTKSADIDALEPYKLLEKELHILQANAGKDYLATLVSFSQAPADLQLDYEFLDTVDGKKGFLVNGELPQVASVKYAAIATNLLKTLHKFHEQTVVADTVPVSVFSNPQSAKLWFDKLTSGTIEYPDHSPRPLTNSAHVLEELGLRSLAFNFYYLLDHFEFVHSEHKHLIHGDLQIGYLNPYADNKVWPGNIYIDTETERTILIDMDWSEASTNYDLAMAYDIGFMLLSGWSAINPALVNALNSQALMHLAAHKRTSSSEMHLLQLGLLAAFFYRTLPRISEYSLKAEMIFRDNAVKRLEWSKRLFSTYGLD